MAEPSFWSRLWGAWLALLGRPDAAERRELLARLAQEGSSSVSQ
jgi:hypothetical protein